MLFLDREIHRSPYRPAYGEGHGRGQPRLRAAAGFQRPGAKCGPFRPGAALAVPRSGSCSPCARTWPRYCTWASLRTAVPTDRRDQPLRS
ncbi:hypothetical protein FHR36_007301 [Kitasatospora paracochleata]|uniref:Uncharacterized protein n=1 Tax=Kitasatospora paracochleata TaxID=58354 RepID=A0ABT1J9H3_9ACTN|nr:hypothetical protein [Kitasatospora paracochleata]